MQQGSLSRAGGVLVCLMIVGCRDSASPPGAEQEAEREPVKTGFHEVSEAQGVSFRHEASEGQYFIPEEMGPGGALFDADGDGDLDLYLVQGGRIYLTEIGRPLPNRFYRNDGGRFTDVTDESGAGDTGYGMGCAAADYDNDGDVDLYVTNVGGDVLLRNDGQGRFQDITSQSGLGCRDFSTSAAFVDVDHDGLLDLYVAVYMAWTPEVEQIIATDPGDRDYRNPLAYPPGQDRLYRNRGDGTFEEITDRAGLGNRPFYGLGVVAADFDEDGRVDIYVANDHQGNFLWMNQGDGTFRDEAMERGCAYNRHGQPEASMGIACEDIDRDGDFDLFLTHFAQETNTFYRNDGGYFNDDTEVSGFGSFGRPDTGFGVGCLDVDNNGELELFIANGAVNRVPSPLNPMNPYAEKNLLLRHSQGTFSNITPESGPALQLVEMSRGAIFGDYDNDGDVDIIVCNNRGPAQILRNDNSSSHHWLSIAVVGTRSNRAGIGAVVTVDIPAGTYRRLVNPHYSYCSSNDSRVHFGLGTAEQATSVRVDWPSGYAESWSNLAADRVHVLREGAGQAAPQSSGLVQEDPPATEDQMPLFELRQRAELAQHEGRWLDAAAAYRQLIDREQVEEGAGGQLGELQLALGSVYLNLRDFSRAAGCFEQAHRLQVEINGSEDLLSAIALSQLGTARSKEGKLEEAEDSVRQALGILERLTGSDSLYTATARRDLAAVLVSRQDFDGAIEEYSRALRVYVARHGEGHPVSVEISRSLVATRRARRQAER